MKFLPIPILTLLALLALSGCGFRQTSTTRSAIEQALLSGSAFQTIEKMNFAELKGKTFFIDEGRFEAIDGKYVVGKLRGRLLEFGLRAVSQADEADLLVWPRIATHAIDDSKFLLGIPAIPVPIPAVGTIETPELALLKLDRQRGRNRMGVEIENRENGELVLSTSEISSTSRYDRWVFLIIFGFTITDLGEPF